MGNILCQKDVSPAPGSRKGVEKRNTVLKVKEYFFNFEIFSRILFPIFFIFQRNFS